MQVALLAGTLATFALAALLAIVVVFTGGSVGTGPSSPLATPSTTTVTSTSPSASSSTSTTPSTTSSQAPVAELSDTDSGGFIDHKARCDFGSHLRAAIRTASSLAVVCENFFPGTYYYHGERLSDGADLKLANATPAGDGFDAVNPADGARYQVRPDQLTISSNRGVDSAERALEYGTE
jgi:serine/threonine-protein kinase